MVIQNLLKNSFKKFPSWRINFLNRSLNSYRKYRPENSRLLGPVLFTSAVGVTSFAGGAIVQYEKNVWNHSNASRNHKSIFSLKSPSNGVEKNIKKWWNSLHEGQKIVAVIIGINTGVFLFWKLPVMQGFMKKWFLCSPSNRRSVPLLLSCFSHSEAWHLGANMFVFWSFAPLIHSILGSEQFVAFYLTGGTVASLFSHFVKISRSVRLPSLGASGALLAVLGACCIQKPEARLSIIFLPFFTFSAGHALYGIITLDVLGLLLRWQMFDHAAHLGGTLFGCWYILYGHKIMWDQRGTLQRWWHKTRK